MKFVVMNNFAKIIYASLLAALVMLFDQVSKFYILKALTHIGQTIEVLPYFNFTLSFNFGISFSMFNSPGQNQLLLLFMSSVIILLFYIWLYRSNEKYNWIPIGMVIGGAVGNMIDRVRSGAVTDFIDVMIMDWHYPTFNVADSFICIGIIMLVFWPTEKPSAKKDA